MPWNTSRPGTHAKYHTPEHRAYCAELKRELKRQGYLECQAIKCLMPSRIITNPNGREPDGLTAGHNDDGVTYRGPEHRACNGRDGAVRGRARQDRPARFEL